MLCKQNPLTYMDATGLSSKDVNCISQSQSNARARISLGGEDAMKRANSNGSKKLHCLTTCYIQVNCTGNAVGRVALLPLNLLGGIGYELISFPKEIYKHGPVSWALDTPGDLAMNVTGAGGGCACKTESCCDSLCGFAEYFPGPNNSPGSEDLWY
jgi:hypothetical protein